MLQENYKILADLTKFTPTYTTRGLKLFEKVTIHLSVHFQSFFLNILTYPNKMPLVKMPMGGETPSDSIFVINGCKTIWCARVKGRIVAKLLKSGTLSLRDICLRDKQGTISSYKNWQKKRTLNVFQLIIFLKDLRQKSMCEILKLLFKSLVSPSQDEKRKKKKGGWKKLRYKMSLWCVNHS